MTEVLIRYIPDGGLASDLRDSLMVLSGHQVVLMRAYRSFCLSLVIVKMSVMVKRYGVVRPLGGPDGCCGNRASA